MTSKSIQKLKKHHKNYDLNVEVTSSNQGSAVMAVKAFLTIFTDESPPKIVKKATSIAVAKTLSKAQSKAVDDVISKVVEE